MSEPNRSEGRASRPVAGMQSEIARKMVKEPPRSFLASLFGGGKKKKVPAMRPCCIGGVLMVLDRSLALDGLVMGINEGGVIFRQASTFIFDRMGAEVSIRFGEYDRRGRIVEVLPEGYRIQLAERLSTWDILALIQSYGVDA